MTAIDSGGAVGERLRRTFFRLTLAWFGRTGGSLERQLRALDSSLPRFLPRAIRDTMAAEAAAMRALGELPGARKVGEEAPNFSLLDHSGRRHSLSELLSRSAVAVAFLRGGWCPYCNLELRALARRKAEIERFGARLLVISPERPGEAGSFETVSPVDIPILVDTGNAVARAYGIAHQFGDRLRTVNRYFGLDLARHNGDESYVLPIPAVFVISPDRRIRFAYANASYADRLEPDALIEAMRAAGA